MCGLLREDPKQEPIEAKLLSLSNNILPNSTGYIGSREDFQIEFKFHPSHTEKKSSVGPIRLRPEEAIPERECNRSKRFSSLAGCIIIIIIALNLRWRQNDRL